MRPHSTTLPQHVTLAQAKQLYQQLAEINKSLYDRNRHIEQELYNTRQLQQSLLPPGLGVEGFNGLAHCHYKDAYLQISGVYMPCDSVGGDLYDVVAFNPQQQDSAIGVALADVSGHGVPASFITALFKASFYRITHLYETPGDVLHHLNNQLMPMITTGDYITALYCRLTHQGHCMAYAGAGHPYPLKYCAQTGEVTSLTENGTPLVWFEDMVYTTGEVSLAPGDKVLTVTDGVTELMNPQQALLGEDGLKKLFAHVVQHSTSELPLLDELLAHLSDFAQGYPLADDMSLVMIEKTA